MQEPLTFGTAPGWILLSAVQRIIPFLKPNLNSSSDGASGKSFALTTPTIFLSHPAASYLRVAGESQIFFQIQIQSQKAINLKKNQTKKGFWRCKLSDRNSKVGADQDVGHYR